MTCARKKRRAGRKIEYYEKCNEQSRKVSRRSNGHNRSKRSRKRRAEENVA